VAEIIAIITTEATEVQYFARASEVVTGKACYCFDCSCHNMPTVKTITTADL